MIKMQMGRSKMFVACLGLGAMGLMACSPALPPPELVAARDAYKKAEGGNAPRLKPAELHTAKEALDTAESEFSSNPDKFKTADLAYVAERKAEYAESQANAAASLEQKAKYQAETTKAQSDALDASNKKVKGLEGAVAQGNTELEKQKNETAMEKEKRLAAEKKAQEAMDALSKSLAVKSEDRGMVITLSGGVLFATGKWTLLAGAQSQLDKVAEALKTQTEKHFVVEGHTDNQGTDDANQTLSQKRADAVRDYLIVHGVSKDSISATGKGPTVPIADNKTVEGRAMNRRVEIIVQK